MSSDDVMSAKKRELLAYKTKLLQEIKYYNKRIEEVRSQCLKTSFVEDSDSSESEEEFSLSIDNGPSATQLKLQQAMLRTSLQATQELTSLQVLQSEVNVLVDDPEIIGEPPVKEPGTWREVTAECRVDLVPFSMTFFVHQPEKQFGQPSYRGLRVVPVKAAHEGELNSSVLPSVGRPSDAVEVMKSYAAAHRSRRTSLARLADKFADTLHMEPMPEGGYLLKCAGLLEVSWTLQNRWSPLAPFHHRMKFEIEYMDESYIKIITQAHRQLSDPSLETDERTFHLAKIISTCLEAQGPTQELYESMSSDPENAQTLKTRRTTLDQEPEGPEIKKKKEKELMAPPKSLPKKTKLKGKENVADNRKDKLKRGNSNENMGSVKKMRTETDDVETMSENDPKSVEASKDVATVVKNSNKLVDSSKTKQLDRASVASGVKNNEAKKLQNKKESDHKVDKNKNDIVVSNVADKNKTDKEKVDKAKASTQKNIQKEVNTDDNADKPKPVKEKARKAVKSVKNDGNTKLTTDKGTGGDGDAKKVVVNAKKVAKTVVTTNNVNKNKEKPDADNIKKVKTLAASKNKPESANLDSNAKNAQEKVNVEKGDADKNNAPIKNKQLTNEKVKSTNKLESKVEGQKNDADPKNKGVTKIKAPTVKTNANVVNTKKAIATNVKPNSETKNRVNIERKLQTDKTSNNKAPPAKTTQDKNKPIENKNKGATEKTESTIEKVVEKRKSVAIKRKSNMVDRTDSITSAKKVNKPGSTANSAEKIKNTITNNKMEKVTKKLTPKLYQKFKSKLLPGGIKTHNGNTKVLGNIEKQNSDKKSKIPQKKLPAVSEVTLKKNPLRISPRKIPSKFKTPLDANKIVQKTTSIPRLLKKPIPKT